MLSRDLPPTEQLHLSLPGSAFTITIDDVEVGIPKDCGFLMITSTFALGNGNANQCYTHATSPTGEGSASICFLSESLY